MLISMTTLKEDRSKIRVHTCITGLLEPALLIIQYIYIYVYYQSCYKLLQASHMPIVVKQIVGKFECVKRDRLFHPLGTPGRGVWVEVHPPRSGHVCSACYQPRRAVESISVTPPHTHTQSTCGVEIHVHSCLSTVCLCVCVCQWWWSVCVGNTCISCHPQG